MTETDRVGPRLRAARQAKGWTLDDLAGRAGMSASTLSRLESGKRQASLELLVPLTRMLGIRIDDLVAPPPDPRVRRPAMRRHGHIVAPLTREDSPVPTYKVTYPPVDDAPAARVHDGFEWFYVLSGRVRLVLGERELVLETGEAAEFDTRTPHSISAVGPGSAEIVSIFNPDGERLHTRSAG
ncbi:MULTISPECIES: helix-turn-helix domain-containing protein [Microbacterium]|uniref:helix-turn-helix domain-containing protein n=1 Tax=Microbacterium TaxID=33882 RepID=UPI0019962C21|nr:MULTISPECIES: XRE family transcriptional regulator [Microbacterium]MBD3757057.1 helix-turn-helix transcriptional regulator [Microbacterium sp.]MBZ6371657.1 XRE family transcriptional regulator [Microbacterium hominis]MCG7414389.1 XRE family transcriptional regulator [Microbacterium aurum]